MGPLLLVTVLQYISSVPPDLWYDTASLAIDQSIHQAALLQDGRVLLADGALANNINSIAEARVYDPALSHWTPTVSMTTSRYRSAAALLRDEQG